uniref:Major sperm protein n=1 Tax=Caenorhabditis tropicalis TaxID=1561998 RepID=A0A1I7U2I9_9PELO
MIRRVSKFDESDPANLFKANRWKMTLEIVGIIVFSMSVIAITWNTSKFTVNTYFFLISLIFLLILLDGEGLRFGLEYNILIYVPYLCAPSVYFILHAYSNQSDQAIFVTMICAQTIIMCLIDIFLVWRCGMKPLWFWLMMTGRDKNVLTVDSSICLIPVTGGTSTHQLINKGTIKLIYKIESSNNDDYHITPVFGFIDRFEKKEIIITRTAGEEEDDELVIHFADAAADATDAWIESPDFTPLGRVTITLLTYSPLKMREEDNETVI